MATLYVAFLYNTLDVEYFYKISVTIFPMPHVYCKSIANEHTLLNKNISVVQVSSSAQQTFPIWLESEFASYRSYLNARRDFSLKFGA